MVAPEADIHARGVVAVPYEYLDALLLGRIDAAGRILGFIAGPIGERLTLAGIESELIADKWPGERGIERCAFGSAHITV